MSVLDKLVIIVLAGLLLISCKDNCIEKDADGTCKVTCNIWQSDRCVHTCTRGIPCD